MGETGKNIVLFQKSREIPSKLQIFEFSELWLGALLEYAWLHLMIAVQGELFKIRVCFYYLFEYLFTSKILCEYM